MKTDEKSKGNEVSTITAIPTLWEMIALQGGVVTSDARGCQYTRADQMVDTQAKYLFALKENQESLYEDVKISFEDAHADPNIATDTTFDGDHGRFETRVHGITGEVSWLIELHPAWKRSKSRGVIDAKREYGDKIFRERRLYVSSLPPDPELFVVVSRAHGAIEHWLPGQRHLT